MSDINIYTCTGRLGGDPQKRTFQNGDSVVNFNLAVSESWKFVCGVVKSGIHFP